MRRLAIVVLVSVSGCGAAELPPQSWTAKAEGPASVSRPTSLRVLSPGEVAEIRLPERLALVAGETVRLEVLIAGPPAERHKVSGVFLWSEPLEIDVVRRVPLKDADSFTLRNSTASAVTVQYTIDKITGSPCNMHRPGTLKLLHIDRPSDDPVNVTVSSLLHEVMDEYVSEIQTCGEPARATSTPARFNVLDGPLWVEVNYRDHRFGAGINMPIYYSFTQKIWELRTRIVGDEASGFRLGTFTRIGP